ncbi:hypothetical protein GCM10010411_74050 [Actinomadura fulvescens]|uniref:Uncharacterized protein n=1 Tax=Actinomadura fulvescens TaxID=46160 RepID=A0ABN3QHZ0_9ACTN
MKLPDGRGVPIERYATHALAALAEGLCPDCPTAEALWPRPVTLADWRAPSAP